MTKFQIVWRRNVQAPWPADRTKIAENLDEMFDAIERYMDAGMIKENGFFVDAHSGSFIFEGTSADVLKITSFFSPVIAFDIKEIIPYEKGKNVMLESLHEKTLAR